MTFLCCAVRGSPQISSRFPLVHVIEKSIPWQTLYNLICTALQDMSSLPGSQTPLRRHGDEFERLPNGYYRALGRCDDTMNLGGIKVRQPGFPFCLSDHQATSRPFHVGQMCRQ